MRIKRNRSENPLRLRVRLAHPMGEWSGVRVAGKGSRVTCRGIVQSAISNWTVNPGQDSVKAGVKPENRASQTWSNLVKPKDFLSLVVGILGKPAFLSNPQSAIENCTILAPFLQQMSAAASWWRLRFLRHWLQIRAEKVMCFWASHGMMAVDCEMSLQTTTAKCLFLALLAASVPLH